MKSKIRDLVTDGYFKRIQQVICDKLMDPRAVLAALVWSTDLRVPLTVRGDNIPIEYETNYLISAKKFATETATMIGCSKQAIADACRVITMLRMDLAPYAIFGELWNDQDASPLKRDVDNAVYDAIYANKTRLGALEAGDNVDLYRTYRSIGETAYKALVDAEKHPPTAIRNEISILVTSLTGIDNVMVYGRDMTYFNHIPGPMTEKVLSRILEELMPVQSVALFLGTLKPDMKNRGYKSLSLVGV